MVGRVLTAHGIAWGPPRADYANRFFRALTDAYAPHYVRVPATWPWPARLSVLAIVLLQCPGPRARAEHRLDRALRRSPGAGRPWVVVATSLGTELTRGWLVRREAAGADLPVLWVTAGTFPTLLGLGRAGGLAVRGGLGARVCQRLALRLAPARPVPGPAVRWVNVYRPADPFGAPLQPAVGRPVEDRPLLAPWRQSLRDHDYWEDPAFAAAVAEYLADAR